MKRLCLTLIAIATLAFADGFTFTIGSPVASQDFRAKAAAFVFRTDGCADLSKSQVSATAEGMVKGVRRTVVLTVAASPKPGVYAVFRHWPTEGDWVVNLKGTCAGAGAGAIVPMGPNGFIRESSKFFPRPATGEEIETVLKAHAKGENK